MSANTTLHVSREAASVFLRKNDLDNAPPFINALIRKFFLDGEIEEFEDVLDFYLAPLNYNAYVDEGDKDDGIIVDLQVC